jgi:transposase-like protein
MRWQDLNAEQRYEMIAMIRTGKATVAQVSETLEVTKQTLYNAIDAAESAAIAALVPGKRGRKPKPEPEVRASELLSQKAALEKELERWKTKYDVVRTLLDFERTLDRGECLPGEKKRVRPTPTPAAATPSRSGPGGSRTPMGRTGDEGGSPDQRPDPAGVDDAAEGARGGPQ